VRNDWRVTVALFAFASFAESLAFGHFAAFTPLYLKGMGLGPSAVATWTGILGSLGFVLGLPLLPFWGPWAARYGRKPVIIRSSVVEAVLFAIAAHARTPQELAVARLLTGFVMGNTGVMMAAQSEITPPGRIGLAVAAIGAGPSVAMAVGPLLGGLVAAHLGLRALFTIDSAATAAAALLMAVVLRERRAPRATAPVGALAGSALRAVVRLPNVRQAFLVFACVGFGTTAVNPYLPIWIHAASENAHLRLAPAVAVGLVFTAAGVAMAVATPVWGWLIDRIGTATALGAAAAGTAVGLTLQGLSPDYGLIAAGRTLQGLFQGGVSPAVTSYLVATTPEDQRAAILNLSILPQQLAYFFAPAIGLGVLRLAGLRGMLLAFAALTLVGAGLAGLLTSAGAPRRAEHPGG
jgi:DHA1 family multidrug resistance protein-like MFS transporter